MAEDIIPQAQPGQGPAARSAPSIGTDYRQLERPIEGIQPYHLQHSGGEHLAEELHRTFQTFENEAAHIGEKIVAKRGKQEGEAAGAAGNGAPLTGLAAITAHGDAYNAAVHTAYIARTKNDIELHLSEIEQDTKGDPAAFEQRARAAAEGALKEAPNLYKPELGIALNDRINAGILRTRDQQIKDKQSEAFAAYTDTRDTRISSTVRDAYTLPEAKQTELIQRNLNDNQDMLNGLVKSRSMTPEAAAREQVKYKAALEKAVNDSWFDKRVDELMTVARSEHVDAADAAFKKMISDPNMSENDKEEISKRYLTASDEYRKMQARVYSDDVTQLSARLALGHYGPAVEQDVNRLYRVGALTEEGKKANFVASIKNQMDAIDADAANKLIDAAVHGTGPKLDPENKDAIKASDGYLKEHMGLSNVAPLSDQWVSGISAFMGETNITPPMAEQYIRAGLVGGDPQQAAQAASAYTRLREANPTLDMFNKDTKIQARATMLSDNLRSGMSPQRAYELTEATINRPEGEKKILDQKYEKAVRDDPNGNIGALRSSLGAALAPGRIYGNNLPDISANIPLQAENERLVKEFYQMTNGDIEKSRELAARQLVTSYRVTSMNGTPEVVKHGIPDSQVPAVRDDMAAHAKELGFTGDPKDLKLIPNWLTDSSGGRIWSVVHDVGGVPDLLLNHNNQAVSYHLPSPPDFARLHAAQVEKDRAAQIEKRRIAPAQDALMQQMELEALSHTAGM